MSKIQSLKQMCIHCRKINKRFNFARSIRNFTLRRTFINGNNFNLMGIRGCLHDTGMTFIPV